MWLTFLKLELVYRMRFALNHKNFSDKERRKEMRIVTLFILGILTVAASGCVSRGRHQQEVASLQGQVAQMDTALKAQEGRGQALEAELTSLRAKGSPTPPLSGTFAGTTYRTPSGFELPAADIQKALKNAGYYAGSVDGKIGPDSREAIRSFQRDNSLTADGVCGKQTWTKLKTYLDVIK